MSSTGTLTYESATDTYGVANCTIYLKDDGGTANGGVDQSPPQTFTITVHDSNEAPTDITLSAASIDENVAIGTTVGGFTTTDPNTGQSFTYSLVSGDGDTDNGKFNISGSNLLTNTEVNYEKQSSYSIRVETTDDGLPAPLSFQKAFTITVNNLNEAPTNITLSSTNVSENAAAGTLVGTLQTEDEDNGQAHIYTLVGGATSSFSISGDSLRTAQVFDYETQANYNITIQTDDQNGGTFQKQFTITIVDENDAPKDITLSALTVDENLDSGAVVGTFSTEDPDVSQGHSYALVAGAGDTHNSLFVITGNYLQTAAVFDYETLNRLSIRVQTTDEGTPAQSYSEAFTITVNNVNDNPTDITLAPDTVSENLAPGRFVGTFTAVDQDTGDAHTFTLAAGGVHNDSFSISGDSLFTAATLDYESTPTLSIKVRATDLSSGFYEKDINVTVINQHVPPVITSSLPASAIVTIDSILTLSGAATGEPVPTFTWYRLHPDSTSPDTAGIGATLTIDTLTKADSAYYYFTVSNVAGTDISDTIMVHVLRPAVITLDLPIQYPAVDGGTAVLSVGAIGDGLMFYQWYEDGSIMQGETGSKLTFDPVDSAAHHGKVYHCEVWNTYNGQLLGDVTSTACQMVVGHFYNPFKVKAESMGAGNNTRVRVKVWSEVDISGFPSTQNIAPWADSVWVLYKTNGYATGVNGASVAMISTQEVKNAAPDSLEKILTVEQLTPPHDSCYWFNYSVLWHRPAIGRDTLLEPFAPAGKVFMVDTVAPSNPLIVYGRYVDRSDTALLHIDSIGKLDTVKDSLVILQCSKFPGFNPLMFDTAIAAPALLAVGDSTTLILDSIGVLPIELDTVYCRWRIIGTNTAEGKLSDTTFTIGWPRPVYPGTLYADSTKFGGEIHIKWDTPTEPADSIRVWWDSDTIPLDYAFTIPMSQSKLLNTSLTTDTVKGLDNDKRYCLGLQIFRDEMWSRVTEKSRAWAKTALGDTSIVPNIISVDSSWFEDSSNAIVVQWHIDTLKAPGDRTYQYGYICSLDSAEVYDTAVTVKEWIDVTRKVNETKIRLSPGIVFDTTYAAGLWLRGYSTVLGAGRKSPPADSSFVWQKTPSFTWEKITIFPVDVDTVWAANKMIFLKKIVPFMLEDIITAFNPGALPEGFVDVGGIFFKFNVVNPDVPPFILGLKYDSLPAGVNTGDLGLYQYINGNFHVMHGFQITDSMVWDTVTNIDLAHPFLILADTLYPVFSELGENTGTISPGADIPVQFSVRDNIANVIWQFGCGPGNMGYIHREGDTLNAMFDTLRAFIKDSADIISELYGVRALITLNDGVHRDTNNVSRFVRSTVVDTIELPANQWEPLRATAYLDDPSIEQLLAQSSVGNGSWVYDTRKYRLYRWYSDSSINTWMEYQDSLKDNFTLVPGRLIWCKTAATQTVSMTGGITTSLREPYEIELKPKDWTDICMPYKFPIMLRDILEENPVLMDSLEVYHWKKSGSVYEALEIYIASMDTITQVTDTMQVGVKNDAYTIYNHSSGITKLKIPPVSLPLSEYAGIKRPSSTHSEHAWQVHFMWRNLDTGKDGFFRRIRCGYRKSKSEERLFGFMPPGMSKVQVGILDTAGNRLSGWALQPSLKAGGIAFDVCFSNTGEKEVQIEYFLDNLEAVPEEYTAKIFDPGTRKYELYTSENSARIAVNPESSTSRIIVIGTEDYMKSLIKGYLPLKFVKAFPNPFNGRIKIQYRIPLGITEVHFTLYNLRGQQLWKGIERRMVTPGYHTFFFDAKTGLNRRGLPAGVYIMRMTAKNKAGKILYGGKKRLTCIK